MKKKSLYEPRKLTYEEHKRIADFFRFFNSEGQEVFDLLRQAFGDTEIPVSNMAKAVNMLSGIHHYCDTKSCSDRPREMDCLGEEFDKWRQLYLFIGLWQTEGWK